MQSNNQIWTRTAAHGARVLFSSARSLMTSSSIEWISKVRDLNVGYAEPTELVGRNGSSLRAGRGRLVGEAMKVAAKSMWRHFRKSQPEGCIGANSPLPGCCKASPSKLNGALHPPDNFRRKVDTIQGCLFSLQLSEHLPSGYSLAPVERDSAR